MSITSTVKRRYRTLVTLLLLVAAVALVAVSPPAGASATGRIAGRATAPATTANDPATRVASLGALVDQRTQSVRTMTARRDDTRARLTTAQQQEQAARARTDALGQIEQRAAARYEKTKARLSRFAAAAYRDGPSVTPLTQLLSSHSAADYAYRHELVQRVGDQQRRIARNAKRDRAAAAAAAEIARNERNRLHDLAAALERDLPARENAVTAAVAADSRAEFWLARWQAIIAGPATPILGPARLSADELSTWFTGTRHHARTTVPIDELAGYYIEEGASTGVRSDIAFAQSMLETGGFSFPDGGQVLGTDNNFAGMGACDSCATGNRFPDARTGVRAQLQQLRVYADPHLTKLDRHHLKGKVPTWAGLTHTWATADTYGDRILQIYEQMLGWLTDRARI
jgi:hypothetical protein